MNSQDPTAWFDQFVPNIIRESDSPQWCARHWAPAAALGANGILATVMLMAVFIDEVAPTGTQTAAALNDAMDNTGKICCTLGDQRMYDIWGKCPPAEQP